MDKDNCYAYIPYAICYGRKYRYPKILLKPAVTIFQTTLCNNLLISLKKKDEKLRFVHAIIRLFYKDSLGFRIAGFFQNQKNCKITEGDEINLICHVTKAVIRKLLLRLNYIMDDYKCLKQRRKYTVLFTFYFINNIENLTWDLTCSEHEVFHFFITLNSKDEGKYKNIKDFTQMLFFYYIEEEERQKLYTEDDSIFELFYAHQYSDPSAYESEYKDDE